MAASYLLPLGDVLRRLSDNWHICKNHYERKCEKPIGRLRRLQDLGPVADWRTQREVDENRRRMPLSEAQRREFVAKLEAEIQEIISKTQELADAFDDHPYLDFVKRLTRMTGVKTAAILEAVDKDFDGYEQIADKLDKLDGTPKLARLYEQLITDHPAIAKTIGLKAGDDSGGIGGARRPTINDRMIAAMAADLDKVKGWTAQKWADHFGCSKGTVGATKTWKGLALLRQQTKAELRQDRHRKRRPSTR